MDRVRLGIAGIGNIAQINVLGYLEHEQCEVTALCDPRQGKVEAMAQKWGVPRTYTDLDEMLASDDIDAVEILTPTYMHHDHVIAAARAGKHISVQKPMANSVAEAREMLAEVDKAGV
ncbi:MAG: Gfo/Idh/MocA family protein, partial [Acidimicrobiales bacterium]